MPIFAKIKAFLEANSTTGSSAWNSAVYYGLVRWDKLTRFLAHGEVEMDSNLIENRIRPMLWEEKTICLLAPMLLRNVLRSCIHY